MQRRWPKNAEAARRQTIEAARAARQSLDDARRKLDKREHPALIALDMADAAALLSDIERLMVEAKIGIE